MIVFWIPFVAFMVVPLLFTVWMAAPLNRSRAEMVTLAVLVATYTWFAFVVSPIWGWIGMGWRWLLPLAYLAAFALMLRRHLRVPGVSRTGWRAYQGPLTNAVVIVVFGLQAVPLALTYRAPEMSVPLGFPMEAGRYLVLQGGPSPAINGHFAVPAQEHAIDIVGLEGGKRASGLLPANMEDYAVFGKGVVAPCAGVVTDLHNGAATTPIGGFDLEAPAGNYVTLECVVEGVTIQVLLAHLQQDTLEVALEANVAAGAPIGLAGSSGNSSEPHLHIHAVVGHAMDHETLITTAQPIAMRFDGRVLRRNSVFEVSP